MYENRTVALKEVSRIDRLLAQSQLALVEAIQNSMTATIKIKSEVIEKNIAEMEQVWAIYTKSILSDEAHKLADTFQSDRDKLINNGLRQTMKAMIAGDLARAGELQDMVQALAIPRRKSVDALKKLQVDE